MEPGGTIPVFKEKRSRCTQFAVCKIYAWHQSALHLAFSSGDGYPRHQTVKKLTAAYQLRQGNDVGNQGFK